MAPTTLTIVEISYDKEFHVLRRLSVETEDISVEDDIAILTAWSISELQVP